MLEPEPGAVAGHLEPLSVQSLLMQPFQQWNSTRSHEETGIPECDVQQHRSADTERGLLRVPAPPRAVGY